MKKVLSIMLVSLMFFGLVTSLASCKSETESKMEENVKKGKEALERIRELKKEAEDIMNRP